MATSLCHDTTDELWRECARWLTQWGMLRPDHKANLPDAGITTLAYILRDGVLLCKLLSKIDPGCIDMKDVNLKPTMAQFLSLRNIELFLKTCVINFGLKESDLFDPLALFELSNFYKVLCTLSELSQTSKSLQAKIPGFIAQRVKTKEEEDMYQILNKVPPGARERDVVDPLCDMASEKIYQVLCQIRTQNEHPPVFEKRDFVLKELLDTEKNYVEVLSKLKRNFMKPLIAHMKPSDHETVFFKINELYDIHAAFYSELEVRDPAIKLSCIFLRWREKFLVYGGYCANLTRATNLLQELCDIDDTFNQLIIKFEKEDNNGRFKLRDVLSVPMQRILKYHLLLDKLIENTDRNHEEYKKLGRAREAMLDVAGFINEAARDSEHLAVINNLQENIVEWDHSNELRLANYGRLIKDGEMKIRDHDDQRSRGRYVFIFDKCILLCKQLKGQQFAYRDIINISDYHVEEIHSRPLLNRDSRWAYNFLLVKNEFTNGKVYTMSIRTIELRNQMIKAINDALDNLHPQVRKRTTHLFELQTFEKPTQCVHCSKYLRGLFFQGYRCSVCNVTVHKACIPYLTRCGASSVHSSVSLSDNVTNGDISFGGKLWFVGEMDRAKAQSELERRDDGTFLVRIRPQNDDKDKFALSLKTNNTVKHMKIFITDTGEEKKYFLSQSKFFSTIEELILNYQTYSLKENFERLEENSMLLWPYRQQHATVLRNFEPLDHHHLQLKEGFPITIIGKEGYKEGWWKGRNELEQTGYFPNSYVRIDGDVKFNM